LLKGYLTNQQDDPGTEKILAKAKASAPRINMHVECYHYETRTTGSGKNRRTRQVKVVTHRASQPIQYGAWRDVSTRVEGLATHGIVRVEMQKGITYHDQLTFQWFEAQRHMFRASNDFDVYQNYWEDININGYKPHILCVPAGVEKPKTMSLGFYVLSTFLCANWFFRYFAVERATTKTTVHIRKSVCVNPTAMAHLPFVGSYHEDFSEEVAYAVVYQQMYGRAQPNMTAEVAQVVEALPVASTVPDSIGYAGNTTFGASGEQSKAQRAQMFNMSM